VQAGVRVAPDTVQVGDPFTITVRVRVPGAARVVWPTLTDSTAVIAPRAPMQRRGGDALADGAREEVATFEVAAWDTGTVATTWPPALVIIGADTVPIRLADARVHVQSVLPADTSLHTPRPAKPPFAAAAPWWTRWWPVLVALLLGALWWLWRRRRQRPSSAFAATPVLGAFERARIAFDRLEQLALTEAGEPGRAVTLALEIVRRYLAARVPRTTPAQTSVELLAAVADDTRVPVDALRALLVSADTVKYAGRALQPEAARRLVAGARALVEDIEARDQAMQAAANATNVAGRDDTDVGRRAA
jgi:signal transduction histidine kinase